MTIVLRESLGPDNPLLDDVPVIGIFPESAQVVTRRLHGVGHSAHVVAPICDGIAFPVTPLVDWMTAGYAVHIPLQVRIRH